MDIDTNMLHTSLLALLLGFWAALYLFDAFLKVHHSWAHWYLELQAKTGISVGIGQLRWYTTYFNRILFRLSQLNKKFWRAWFTLGVVFGLVSMGLSMFVLTMTAYNTLRKQPVEQQILSPVMPGVNLPASQIGYYLLTLLVCGILHEVGHAVAAIREQVRVNGFGLFVMGIYPGAFVDLYTDHLQAVSPLRQLRIFCAGVWHNFVIVMVAIALLCVLPWMLWPFYNTGISVAITSVVPNSAVWGARGLFAGDEVIYINKCAVSSVEAWLHCVTGAMNEKSAGYCVPLETLRQQDISQFAHITPYGHVECCANTSNTHLCFTYHMKGQSDQKRACLPARTTTDRQTCALQSDCYHPTQLAVCATPALENSTKLLKVQIRNRQPLLFLGHPLDLHYAVTLSNYVPASTIVPLNLPYMVEIFSKYLISLSGALALLNVVPCYALDGQFILQSGIELLLPFFVPDSKTRKCIYCNKDIYAN